MSVNDLKKFAVKIKYSCIEDSEKVSRKGSGVIFKPTENSRYSYVFTAKHTFFNDEDFKIIKKIELNIASEADLSITKELGNSYPTTSIFNNKVYFLSESENLDFAFFIIEDDSSNFLEIYDTDDEPDFRKEDIIIIGYPKLSKDSISPIHSFGLKRRQRVTNNNNIEIFVSDGESSIAASDHRSGIKNQIRGISGAGVFVMGNKGTQKLCSIQYAGDYHNSFRCITLDGLVDSINERLRKINETLPSIQCGEKLIKDGGYLSFEDFTDFDFFKNKIKKSIIFKDNQEEYKEHLSQSDIKKIGDITNSELEKVTEKTDKLSYKYAYLAILSHENKNYHAATRYFKKAEKLNKVHAHTLIYEKANREKDTKKILNIRNKDESKEEKTDRLDQLLKNPIISLFERRKVLQEIIFTLVDKEDPLQFEEKKSLKLYVKDLTKSYLSDETIRENYKYLELGYSLQHLDSSHDYAIYFFTIANNITKGLPQSKGNKELTKTLSKMISEGRKLNQEKQNDADKIAGNYLKEKESHYLGSDIKNMIYDMYDDTCLLRMDGENIKYKINKLDKKIINYQNKNNETSELLQQNIESTKKSLTGKVDIMLPELFKNIKNDFYDALNSSLNGLDNISKEDVKAIVNSNIDEIEKAISNS